MCFMHPQMVCPPSLFDCFALCVGCLGSMSYFQQLGVKYYIINSVEYLIPVGEIWMVYVSANWFGHFVDASGVLGFLSVAYRSHFEQLALC